MTLVEMPKANENLTEATLDRWLLPEGAAVSESQAICEIITDKAKFEMPAPCAGVLLKHFALERSVLPVGYVLCAIGQSGEAMPFDVDAKNGALAAAHRGSLISGPTSPGVTPDSAGSNPSAVRATPAARRVAKELGIDLAAVAGALNLAGPVNEKDVRAFSEKR